jgi:endonuclease III
MTNSDQITNVFRLLEQTHQPTMLEELSDYTPFQMLVMTLLSARTKDSTVIPIVKKMFSVYPGPKDFLSIDIEDIQKLIYGVGFFRVKARHLKELSMILVEKYNSIVPDTLDELITLPGVGRKTANCILAYTFKKPAIAVDIHVHRIANRLGWIKTNKESESELALQKIIPYNEWINVNKLLVGHGQTVCRPRNPMCSKCNVSKYCEYDKNIK